MPLPLVAIAAAVVAPGAGVGVAVSKLRRPTQRGPARQQASRSGGARRQAPPSRAPINYRSNWRSTIQRPPLTVRGVYTAQAGENLQVIASRAGVFPSDIQRLNPGLGATVAEGQSILVPNPTQRSWARAVRRAATTAD